MNPAAGADARVVVIGAGHGGAAVVALLRQGGHRGEIVLLGDELAHPYQRPPLSKDFAGGELAQWLRPAEFYAEQAITLRLGERVAALHPDRKRVVCSSGEEVPYDVVVLATGARPRTLPIAGIDLTGVATLRTLEDARELRKWVEEKRRLVIIGGGYIGLEVAAAAAAGGASVTILEREERVLSRVASAELSEVLAAAHRAHGVEIRTNVRVSELSGTNGAVREVVLDEPGGRLAADGVLVGVGAVPCSELGVEAGIECEEGLLVDGGARTSDPAVLAIGDVTSREVLGAADRMRLESIPNATEQAKQAVASILGTALPPPEIPWFWSDQLDLKLKIAGVVRQGSTVVQRGDASTGKFALFHIEDDRVRAVETSNSPADFLAGKKLIATGARVDLARLADPAVALRDVVAV